MLPFYSVLHVAALCKNLRYSQREMEAVMDVRLVGHEFSLAPVLRDFVERRLNAAFRQVRGRVSCVVVHLRTLSGAHGARDKVCDVRITIPGRPELLIHEAAEDMAYAIESAVKRAAHRALRMASLKRAPSPVHAGP